MSRDSLVRMKIFPEEVLEGLVSVAIVGDPILRFMRVFRDHIQTHTSSPTASLDDYLTKVELFHDIHETLGLHSFHGFHPTLPHTKWFRPKTWGGPRNTPRLENLAQEIRFSGLGLPWKNLGRNNRSAEVPDQKFVLSKAQRDRISHLHGDDFSILGY